MKIIKKKTADLKAAPYNPRVDIRKDKKFYEALYKSITKFGYVEPIIWNKQTGNVVGGNQRLAILEDSNKEEVEVVEVDLSLDDEKALNIALNKVSGDWDDDKLNTLLNELSSHDYLMDLTGFTDEELEGIINIDNTEESFDTEEALQRESKYKVESGEIYILGNHTLMCGDSTKEGDIKALLGDTKIDMVFTDPPYGIDIVKDNRQILFGDGIVPVGKHKKIIGDNTTETAVNTFKICKDTLKIKNIIMWGGNYYANELPSNPCWIIWDKREDVPSNNFADCEIAYTTFKKPSRIYRQLWSGLLRKGDRKTEGVKRLHPTQKPVKLHINIINDYSKELDYILDLFGGSGSTLIACEQTNRNCYMMELDPHYCSVIIERWEEYTGGHHEKR